MYASPKAVTPKLVCFSDVYLVPLLLANPRVSLNVKDHYDWDSTPLMHAVKENKREIVEMLLADTRSDLNTIDCYERRGDDLAR